MDVRFSDLAVAGLRNLFQEEWRRIAFMQSIAWALRADPTLNARPCMAVSGDFFVRVFFAGFEVRVLYEVTDAITVWTVTPAPKPI